MIKWKYLNTQTATIDAIQDFENMNCIINLTYDMSYTPNTQIHGSTMNNSNINGLNDKYKQAVQYMNWFKPAWDTLSEEERIILAEFYLVLGNKTDAVKNICKRLFCCRSNVYHLKDKAMVHLSILLFGY